MYAFLTYFWDFLKEFDLQGFFCLIKSINAYVCKFVVMLVYQSMISLHRKSAFKFQTFRIVANSLNDYST